MERSYRISLQGKKIPTLQKGKKSVGKLNIL